LFFTFAINFTDVTVAVHNLTLITVHFFSVFGFRKCVRWNKCILPFGSVLSSSLLCRNLKVKIYKTIILPLVFYGCETWFPTLREVRRLRVFEKRVLRGIFGPKRDEVTGERRKLRSGELHNLFSSLYITRQIKSRRMRWAGHVARMGEGRNVYRVLVGQPEGKRPLGRPRHRWEDGIRMDVREIVWGVWSGFTWLRIGTVGGLL
jgi:hypothetical protein